MKLSDLAISSYGYVHFTDYEKSYLRFLKRTNNSCDLTNAEHRKALLDWLNDWGCRQFSKAYRRVSAKQILLWYREYRDVLFSSDKSILELQERELGDAYEAFEALSVRVASIRMRNGKKHQVTVGPTGASKILFAVRREALVAWDEAVRKGLKADGTAMDYLGFLQVMKTDMQSIEKQCRNHSISLGRLPAILERQHATVPQLISEYYWAKYTRNCAMPEWQDLKRLTTWARGL